MDRNKATAKKRFDNTISNYAIEVRQLEDKDTSIIRVVLKGEDLETIKIIIDSKQLIYTCGLYCYVFGINLLTSPIDFFSRPDIENIEPKYWAEKSYININVLEHDYDRFTSTLNNFIETNYGNLEKYLEDDNTSYDYYSLLESFSDTTGYSQDKLRSFLLDISLEEAFDGYLDDRVFTEEYLYACYVINYVCTKLSKELSEKKETNIKKILDKFYSNKKRSKNK